MSVQIIMSILEKLEKMHRSLLEHAYRKTELVTKGDMEELDQVLKIEQSHVAAIETLEQQRQQLVTEYLRAKGIAPAGTATVADVIEATENEEQRIELKARRNSLISVVEELKKQNELNQKLVYQSLQFVNMTMETLRPSPEQINYSGKEVRGQNPIAKKGYFDSQA
ncbi:flagellar protein FlgN [Ureibacillus sp. NPDC094379]